MTEIELLRLAQDGDYDAFEQLHALLSPGLLRFVTRLCGSAVDADDIVQDTLLSLYLNLDRVDPPEKLRPYVFRIARNRCYDLHRRDGRYESLSLDDEPVSVRVSFDLADEARHPEDAAYWLLLNLEVREAMDSLPDLQRQTLLLYAEEGMTYNEIAEVMDVNIGTVKSRLFHAKKTLRARLKPETLAAIERDLSDETTPNEVDTPDTTPERSLNHG